MNKYISEETKKWDRRLEILEAIEKSVKVFGVGLVLIMLAELL